MQKIREKGFSLVELMVVLAIVSIGVAIAVPTYTKYVIRENRTNVEAAMVQISQKLSNYKLLNNNYNTSLSNSAIYGSTVYPQTGAAQYDLTLDTTTVAGGWTLTATPKSATRQAGNRNVVLNDLGQKCWLATADCTPSATSNW
jgi:type IV pilus assembly protein PilE